MGTPRNLLTEIVRTVCARRRCEGSAAHVEWYSRHSERLIWLARHKLPRGSGLDVGTSIDREKTNDQRLVLHTSFHHMDEHGGYDGWTEHTIVVTPSFEMGYSIRVTGQNRNNIKDYLGQLFHDALDTTFTGGFDGYPDGM